MTDQTPIELHLHTSADLPAGSYQVVGEVVAFHTDNAQEKMDVRLRNVLILSAGFYQIIGTNIRDWFFAAWFRRDQGLLINLMRIFFLCSLIPHYLIYLPVAVILGQILCFTGCLYLPFLKPSKMEPKEYGHETFRLATDLYMFAFTLLLIWCYCQAVTCRYPQIMEIIASGFGPVVRLEPTSPVSPSHARL